MGLVLGHRSLSEEPDSVFGAPNTLRSGTVPPVCRLPSQSKEIERPVVRLTSVSQHDRLTAAVRQYLPEKEATHRGLIGQEIPQRAGLRTAPRQPLPTRRPRHLRSAVWVRRPRPPAAGGGRAQPSVPTDDTSRGQQRDSSQRTVRSAGMATPHDTGTQRGHAALSVRPRGKFFCPCLFDNVVKDCWSPSSISSTTRLGDGRG